MIDYLLFCSYYGIIYFGIWAAYVWLRGKFKR